MKKVRKDLQTNPRRVLLLSPREQANTNVCGEGLRKGRRLKNFHISTLVNKKWANKQNTISYKPRRSRKSQVKLLSQSKILILDESTGYTIPEDETFDDEMLLRKPMPRTLWSMARDNVKFPPAADELKVGELGQFESFDVEEQRALLISIRNLAELESVDIMEQMALMASLHDSQSLGIQTPAGSSWQDIGGSRVSTGIGGSEVSIPLTVSSWVDVARGVVPGRPNAESEDPETCRSEEEESWSFME